MVYNKLVRDKIPEIIENSGEKAKFYQLSQDAYIRFLEQKLDEEVGEYHCDKTVEELADILEVVYALSEAQGCSKEVLMDVYQAKHDERGGFRQRYFLISSD